MRRGAWSSVLALLLAFGLSGPNASSAEQPLPGATPGRLVEPAASAAPPVDQPQSPLPQPAAGPGFTAVTDAGAISPPDPHGAVGPTTVLTMTNFRVQGQDKSGAVQAGWPVTLWGFWQFITTAPSFPPGKVIRPRVVFDPDPAYGGRWILVSSQLPADINSGLLVGVLPDSVTLPNAIPLSQGHLFDADASNLVWASDPTVGFNRKFVVVQVNLYKMSDSTFDRSRVYVFRKADLYAYNFTPAAVFSLETSCEGSTCGSSQVPASDYDLAEDDLYLVQSWSPAAGTLRLYRISEPGVVTLTPLLPLVSGGVSSAASASGGADLAPQPSACSGHMIQTGDSRILSAVYRNGTLWAAHTVFLPSPERAAVQWWQIKTDSTALQHGLVDGATASLMYAFPSLAVNKNDDVLLGFSTFTGSTYASAGYTFHLANDPQDAMQAPVVLKAGGSCYYNPVLGKNVWGDYSAAAVDPADDTSLWTLQEYASATANRWGTWWGMVQPPSISIADASVAEGNSGTTLLTFNLTLSEQVSDTVTVQWTTADDTATDGDGDYVPASGTVTFLPLATAATLQVAIKGDVKVEPNERFFVNLSSPQFATVADPQAVGTISNDDLPRMSIGDVRLLEGNSGLTAAKFTVTLSEPSASAVSATWATVPNTAFGGFDFTMTGGTVSFPANDATPQTVTVQVVGDVAFEPDETFFVDLSSPVGVTISRSPGYGVIVNDDYPNATPTVSDLNVVSDGDAVNGRNRLQWLNPNPATPPSGIRIKFTHDPTSCTAPVSATPPSTWHGAATDTIDLDLLPADAGKPYGSSHGSLVLNDQYCYAVWGWYGGTTFSTVAATASGRTFTPDKIKWKYFIGSATTTLTPPTVGQDGVLVPSNDGFVHAMTRSATGGPWPTTPVWTPANLGSPAQERSPIIPLPGTTWAYFTTQDGWVHAIDAKSGAILWETFVGTGTPVKGAQAAPAGIFTAFGGKWSYLLVGTRADNGNKFYALDPFTGAVVDAFPRGTESGVSGLGPMSAMAAVDYLQDQVYFGTRAGTLGDATETLWCLKLGPPSDALQLAWRLGTPGLTPGEIDGSPVLRGNRVYVGDMDGKVWSLKTDGTNAYARDLGDGAVKGFPFPDRRNFDLFVATSTKVWGLTDNVGTSLGYKWATPVQGLNNPSAVLFRPGTNELYVGVEDLNLVGAPDFAGLLQIDVTSGSVAGTLKLDDFATAAVTVGAPSLDGGFGLLHVGSANGVLYAVSVPF
jgi:outer membrane protein assembly factor BamB